MNPRLGVTLRAVSVRRGERWALRDISVTLRPGERWALLGGNGAGKTQLLKLLSADVWPTPVGPEQRVYRLGQRRCETMDAKRRMAYVGAELQDKYARYGWDLSIRDLVATGLHGTDLLLQPVTPEEARRTTHALRTCGLTRLAARKFLSLSYGQKRLALLARALVQDPDWLLLDEFYNGLDADFRQRIDAVLDAARRRGQSWVAAAHRAMDVPRGTERLLELARGRVRSCRRLAARDFTSLAERAAERGAERGARRGAAAAPRREGAPGPAPAPRPEPASAPAPAPRHVRSQPLIRVSRADLYVEYRLVVRNLNWSLRAGEHWAVFGANGAGKSSFLKMLYGDLSPALGGVVQRRGFPKGTPIAAWKRHVGFVSPELQSDYAVNVSVRDLVASGRHASIGLVDEASAQDRRIAARWLKFFRLSGVAECRPRELSYGQLRRALIARALAGNARILLLDEPLTGLDPEQRAAMKRLLERLMRRGVTIVAAVHHREDLPRGMTHGLLLHNHAAVPVEAAAPFDAAAPAKAAAPNDA